MPLFYQPEIANGSLHLDEDESRHAVKVMRLREGDGLEITDGQGKKYDAIITDADAKKCSFKIVKEEVQPKKSYYVHIAVAPTKNIDRIEWFLEKAVEIGVDEVSFVLCDKSERKTINLERLEKMAISAMKQSQQLRVPVLNAITPLASTLRAVADEKYMAYVDRANPDQLKKCAAPGKNYLLLIGPEGDFSSAELQMAINNGFQKVSLGPNRLRTETAALAGCLILNLINQ